MICVYNGAESVLDAIHSILNQTYTDLELIVVDDGSTDDTAVRIRTITDPRLRFFTQPHRGIPHTRNHALSHARAPLLAVLDADDTAHPTRLATQIAYMQTHPQTVLLGAGYIQQDHLRGVRKTVTPPPTDAAIRHALLRGNPFCHSTVIMRRSAIEQTGPYSTDFPFVQDYELWSRLAQCGQLANLPDPLVTRHYSPHSVSNNFRNELYRFTLFARANHRAIQRLNAPPTAYFFTVRAILLFFLLDTYAALKNWWRQTIRRQP
jgi:glycosyltransferase involved in cell wall biosynthesis